MTNKEQTVFEKIINQEIPADIWFQTDYSIAFLDINPISLGHTLLISKEPYRWIQDVPANELGQIMSDVPKLINKLIKATGADYIQVAVMGLDVPHFHTHLIPRKFGDNHNELHPDAKLKNRNWSGLLERLQNN